MITVVLDWLLDSLGFKKNRNDSLALQALGLDIQSSQVFRLARSGPYLSATPASLRYL